MSEARAMAVAWYAPVSPEKEGQSTIRIGTITVAADNPASPVPTPAPMAAITYQNHSTLRFPPGNHISFQASSASAASMAAPSLTP